MVKSTLSEQQVFSKMVDILMEALGVDENEVILDASLVNDLGAESIDFLDIVFRLEKQFGVKISQGELFGGADISTVAQNLIPGEYDEQGNITTKGLSKLRNHFPGLDISKLKKSPKLDEIPGIFTVKYLVDFVMRKLAE